jgi:hypothetical protein
MIVPVSMAAREYAFRKLMTEFDRMSEEQISERFKELGFLDGEGHQLTSRIEFLALVKLAKRNNCEYLVLTA